MKKLISLGLLATIAAGAHAVTLTATLDVTGIETFDFYGDANNISFVDNLDAVFAGDYTNYVLTGLGWNVNVTTVGASWLSEMVMSVENGSNTDFIDLSVGAGDDFGGTNVTYSSGGILDLATIDPGLPIIFDNDDNIRFEFWDSFDDNPNAVDGIFNSGTVTLQFEATAVPEPATMAVLGLGALAAMRRRRAK